MVPRALFMPDGRVIPTCVIKVEVDDNAQQVTPYLSFPSAYIGGGYIATSTVQNQERIGSIGCVVTDGDLFYALTNRHVTGGPGRPIYTYLKGKETLLGFSDEKQVGKKAFEEAYPGYPATQVFSNIDAGLIRIQDISQWTSQIYGLGPLDIPVNLTTDNITLDLIGCPVYAYGAASGKLAGSIDGLFYRYKSMGGFDYMADLLIGPTDSASALPTKPGDSGTVWCLLQPEVEGSQGPSLKKRLRPIAMQWGGHTIIENGKTEKVHTYALATCLSTICRELDIDIYRGMHTGLPNFWGDLGHYTIAEIACTTISAETPNLAKLMLDNLERLTYSSQDIEPDAFKGLSKADFVPLADVPDKVWKMFGDGKRGQAEHPNHFADMDKKNDEGKTLLDICKDPKNINVQVWKDYYTSVGDSSRGLLPFRVWQLYNVMVDALTNLQYKSEDKIARFVCAAGILAHYIGDSCQPLHISHMFNGDPDNNGMGKGVHSAYESKMLNQNHLALRVLVQEILVHKKDEDNNNYYKAMLIKSGEEAANSTVQLMQYTINKLKPTDIIKVYSEEPDALWENFKKPTAELLVAGAEVLTKIWQSAWKEGGGEEFDGKYLVAVEQETLKNLYLDNTFAPSKTLDDIELELSNNGKGKLRELIGAS